MEVVIVSDAAAVGEVSADAISALVQRKPDAVLGLATGSSPSELYRELARRVATDELSLAQCRGFLLDEYVGLPADHPQRYRTVIETEVVTPTDLRSERVQGPDGLAADLPGACADYERSIQDAGGIDLQILGVGSDGHIAFNEPGSSLGARTRIKTLTDQTRRDNARYFGDDIGSVPHHCLTQGIGTILQARHLVLLASGRAKAEALHQVVEGPVTAMWPGSALQLHPHVTAIVDEAAASRLQLSAYYRDAYRNKPAWQGL
ncbi:glucosamine-6-phosphate deaminase [Kocuria sp. CNJ-770]|uniref:Glucosamine-6-phosphate deaminase n=1 Tax=Kocuria oceani TaxID=988827 RepID=A0ABV9TKF6_9MICC|nr:MULTISPECIES: glucosamine-6-phosphate deaminase [Kocuria]OLT12108.1 glucosamine-6-phosphate deaminase [Kocuria sp. CNJ-770]